MSNLITIFKTVAGIYVAVAYQKVAEKTDVHIGRVNFGMAAVNGDTRVELFALAENSISSSKWPNNQINIILRLARLTIVCKRFEPHFSIHPPPSHPLWLSFFIFSKALLFKRLFGQFCPIEIPDKHKNKLMLKSHFFVSRRLKNNVTSFFYKCHFYKQHLAEI